MGVRSYRELFAWQLADQFSKEVVDIVRESTTASQDHRYRAQILEAARAVSKDIAEGFMRKSPRQFATFLSYAVGSLAEAEDRLSDGIHMRYFPAARCQAAFLFAKRCTVASIRLRASQIRYAESTSDPSRTSSTRRT